MKEPSTAGATTMVVEGFELGGGGRAMLHQGVHYDTGTVFRGPGYAISTRPTALDMDSRSPVKSMPGGRHGTI